MTITTPMPGPHLLSEDDPIEALLLKLIRAQDAVDDAQRSARKAQRAVVAASGRVAMLISDLALAHQGGRLPTVPIELLTPAEVQA